MSLPVNIDDTYEDDAVDASVKEHQEHHDELHAGHNQRSQELAYAETGTNFTNSTTTYQNVPGLSITIECDGETPIYLKAYLAGLDNDTAGGWAVAAIQEGGVDIRSAVWRVPSAGHFSPPLTMERRLIPSSGTHTYNVVLRMAASPGSTATLYSNNPVSYIQAHRVDSVV